MDKKLRCETCKYCYDFGNSNECRRYPPRIFESCNLRELYPKAVGGCGEHRPLENLSGSGFGVDACTLTDIVNDLRKQASAPDSDCTTTALKLGMSPGYFSRIINRQAIPSPKLLSSLGYEVRYFKRK